ncbi:SUMF1/EgtB/PvdO family nonheme iron enzyme [candidate division KSB1 bacterium]|nr:SUMF1/EgtB/PvdO family nonheme iron enzyme [candidate division KSB1 bacterium]
MPHLGKVVFPFFIFFLLNISSNQAISQTQDSTKGQSLQASKQDSATLVAKTDSLQQKPWIERNPVLVGFMGALIGAAVALIGVLINRQTKKKTSKFTEAEKRTQIRVEKEEKEESEFRVRDEIEARYLRGLEKEHGKINLYGFQSTANVKVKTLDVFVSLRFAHYGREKMPASQPVESEIEHAENLTPEKVLQLALKKKRLLLIIGDPGSGKTTLLKYYALNCLDEQGRKELALKREFIPILLPLRKVDPQKPFSEALSEWATEKNYPVSAEQFENWLEKRGALVMLDGLDEISEIEKRKQVCEWIDNACSAYANSQFIVTCRYTGYRVTEGVELHSDQLRTEVRDLDPKQQELFLKNWFTAAYDEEPDAKDQPQDVADAVLKFLQQEENKSLKGLAGTPVLLQIMAILWKEYRGLVSGRASLYEKCTDYLLDRRDRAKKLDPVLPAHQAKILLRPLALLMQEKLKSDDISKKDLIDFLTKTEPIENVKPGTDPQEFVDNLYERAGLFKTSSDDHYIFSHKSFREFLAAEQLAKEIQQKSSRANLLVDNFEDGWWRETLLFTLTLSNPVVLPEFLQVFLPHKTNAGGFPMVLEQIIREAQKKPVDTLGKFVLDSRRSWQNRHNALHCLRLIVSEPAKAVVKKVFEEEKNRKLKSLAEEILSERQAEEQPLTVRVAEEIKVGETVTSFRNPIELNAEYILIKGGKYEYSVDKNQAEVPDIYFAKYPVTNKLYRLFINYLGGRSRYEQMSHGPNLPLKVFTERLLEEAEKTAGFIDYLGKTPNDWPEKLRSRYDTEKRFNGEDQPIVGVTWFAATVYCHWLTELNRMLRAQKGKPEQKRTFRLPTEQEWEWAAGSGNRKYPWGDKPEPDKTRANFGEEVGHTTPVGSYPEGATPEGLMDMAGNVWEWMANLYKKDSQMRALRGGSWNLIPERLQCFARFRNDLGNGDYIFGFRVVCLQS